MKIKRASKIDAIPITELTMRSKNYWNYGLEQMEEWRDDLTVSAECIDTNHVFKALDNECLIGFYAYQAIDSKTVKLNYLFVEPKLIGKGYGKGLMNNFLTRIQNEMYQKVTLDADPNAEQFYKRFGFEIIGKLKSSIKNRFLPIMELKI